MDNIRRAALIAQLAAIDSRIPATDIEKLADKIRAVETKSGQTAVIIGESSNLTPTKAERLISMFSGMIDRYSRNTMRTAARIVTAQRPSYEGYRYKSHNGAQEMARRRKQMERGQMRRSNGLLYKDVEGALWSANSHGVPCRFYS